MTKTKHRFIEVSLSLVSFALKVVTLAFSFLLLYT